MNGYVRALLSMPYGYIKLGLIKLLHPNKMYFGKFPRISLLTEISLDFGAIVKIGDYFNMRETAKIRARNGAKLELGNNVSLANGCMIVCHDSIKIGNDVQLAPNVLIYDHDHDFTAPGGIRANKYKMSPVEIGNNVWIGANTVILRGTKIGDNCVVGAGSVLKGCYDAGSIIIQKRIDTVKKQ